MDFIYPVIIIIGLALFIHIGTRAFKKIKKERNNTNSKNDIDQNNI